MLRTANTKEEAKALYREISVEIKRLDAAQELARRDTWDGTPTVAGGRLRDPEASYRRMSRLSTLDAELYYLAEVWDVP